MKSKIIFLLVIILVGAGIWYTKSKKETLAEIKNFDDCVAAGNPVMESYPAQCRSKDGRLFVQEIKEPVIPEAVKIAKTYAAQLAKVNEDEVTIISFSQKEWSDGCLGLASTGEMCTQVITPGYEAVFSVKGKELTYRTNNSGNIVRLASSPEGL